MCSSPLTGKSVPSHGSSHSNFSLQTTGGVVLHGQAWEPQQPPRAAVALIHGLGEHSGRYQHLAAALNAASYPLLAVDLRGHGQSSGPRGHAASHAALHDDLALLLAEAAVRFPGLPIFLYGHSMGGNLVLTYCLRRRPALAGVIATGPHLRLAFDPPAWKLSLGRALNRLAPSVSMSNELDLQALSRDPAVVQAYRRDPLVHDRISARLAISLLQEGAWALAHASEWTLPLLLMHGSADRLTSAAASQEFASRVPGDCTYKLWEGLYHEIHNEPEQAQVFPYTLAWLANHIP